MSSTLGNDVPSFGTLLKAFRKRRHLTQQHLADTLGMHRDAVGRWERGDFLPASKTIVLEIAHQLHLDEAETRALLEASLTALSPHWSVPLPRNPFFTGREEVLETLHRQLRVSTAVALTQSSALCGLGGVGKTQIALEYAYRHSLEYSAVFWISAETAESCLSSLVQIAEALQLPGCADQQRVVVAVQHWLATHRQWLLIWDNVEDLELLDRLLPPVRQGAILLTTRCQTLGTRAEALDLMPMEHEEGVLFLLRRAKVLAQTGTVAQVRQLVRQRPAQYQAAAEVVTQMGGLPLALDQAGAYLEATRCSLPAYLELFRTQRAALLQQRGEGAREHPASVWATFTLALAATTERHPAVRDLLQVCALLQAEAIPEDLFRQAAAKLGTPLETVCCDPLAWNQVVGAACAYSLLARQPEEQTLSLHRLVQAILLETMTEAERALWSSRVSEALDAMFPDVPTLTEQASWKQCERLLPHALRCLHQAGGDTESLVFASLAVKVAQYLRARGQYAEVEPLYLRALQIREQTLGPDHLEVARVLNALAILYVEQGAFEEAGPLYLRALHIREQVVGAGHPLVCGTLNNLALLCWMQGNYTQAEAFFHRALRIVEQDLTPDGDLRARTLTNLAHLYRAQGRAREAEELFQQALAFWEQTLGPASAMLAEPLTGLAHLAQEQGRTMEAETLYQRARSLREQLLGPDHHEVVYSLTGLAGLYREQGRVAEAEALYRRAWSIWKQHFGETHLGVGFILTRLAGLYREQGRVAEAEALYHRALSIREQALGAAHPEVAETLHELALFQQQQGRLQEALSLAHRALGIRSTSLGDAHPNTLETCRLHTELVHACAQKDMQVVSRPPRRPSTAGR